MISIIILALLLEKLSFLDILGNLDVSTLEKNLLLMNFDSRVSNISNTSDGVSSGYPNTEKRVENTTRSGVFLTKFEVFG